LTFDERIEKNNNREQQTIKKKKRDALKCIQKKIEKEKDKLNFTDTNN
jgi:hypothetical protein